VPHPDGMAVVPENPDSQFEQAVSRASQSSQSILRAHQPVTMLSAQEMVVEIGDPLAAGVGQIEKL
jgi:hypothetical protein